MKKRLIKRICNHFIACIVFLSLNLSGMVSTIRLPITTHLSNLCKIAIAGTLAHSVIALCNSLKKDYCIQPTLQPMAIATTYPPLLMGQLSKGIPNRLKRQNYQEITTSITKDSAHFYSNTDGPHNIFKISQQPIGSPPRLLTVSQMAWDELKKGNFPGAIIRILIMGIPFCDTSTLFTVEGNLKFPWQPNYIQ